MITLPLIFPLNILPKTGRQWAVQGRQQACTLWQWSCRGEGWMLLHPQALTVAPGRSGEGAHLGSASIQISAASKPGFREVKENSKPQCFWFPRNIQSCALQVVPWHGWSTFLPKIYQDYAVHPQMQGSDYHVSSSPVCCCQVTHRARHQAGITTSCGPPPSLVTFWFSMAQLFSAFDHTHPSQNRINYLKPPGTVQMMGICCPQSCVNTLGSPLLPTYNQVITLSQGLTVPSFKKRNKMSDLLWGHCASLQIA